MSAPWKRLCTGMFTVATCAGFAVCGCLLMSAFVDVALRGGGREILVVGLGGVLLFWVLVAVHELGHVVAAWGLGFHILRIVVGPIKLVREGQRLRAQFNRSLYRLAGFVVAVPSTEHALARRMAVYAAGGPLANLLAGSLSLAGACWFGDGRWFFAAHADVLVDIAELPDLSWWLGACALLNGALFFGCLAPLPSKGLLSDGNQLVDWLGGGRRAERNGLALMLNSAMLGGMRPRDWSRDLVERMLALREHNADDLSANQLAYYYFLDGNDVERAGESLHLALEQSESYPPGFRTPLFLEAAYFQAFHAHDLAEAQAWWQEAKGGDVEKQTWLRVEAALLLAEGRHAEAAAKAEAGLALIPDSWDPGGSLAEKDWLLAIVERAQAGAVKPH